VTNLHHPNDCKTRNHVRVKHTHSFLQGWHGQKMLQPYIYFLRLLRDGREFLLGFNRVLLIIAFFYYYFHCVCVLTCIFQGIFLMKTSTRKIEHGNICPDSPDSALLCFPNTRLYDWRKIPDSVSLKWFYCRWKKLISECLNLQSKRTGTVLFCSRFCAIQSFLILSWYKDRPLST